MLRIFAKDDVLTLADLRGAESALESCNYDIKHFSEMIETYRKKRNDAIDSKPKLEKAYADMLKQFKAQP